MTASGDAPDWCIVIAFYNERDYLPATLRCALAQRHDSFHVVLVDNGSTDGTAAAIAPLIAGRGDVSLITESEPGQTCALRRGFLAARALGAAKLAFWDADTRYPPDYLAKADRLLGDDPRTVAAMAIDLYDAYDAPASRWQRWRLALTSRLLSSQAHTGTFGQAFRMAALADAGGPKSEAWPYVLHDHELVNRVRKLGRMRYAADHVCWPSPRRGDSGHTRWTLAERILYHLSPAGRQDWFFYRFLAPRLAARGCHEIQLRVRDW